ncbi:MAG: hypothetical protein IJM54_06745 [Thermoguttaceae bacterium]|nr:hypothetical protein [Thermoguttaceae bacterium]MBR4752266.1 hypothetical protein [Thermoguttaceae bacterium]MBR5759593.1 hypothetical protein [Thermoguttaceae bacterium]
MASFSSVSTLFAASEPVRMNWDAVPSLILALVGLGIFVAIAVYVLSKIRAGQKSEEVSPSEMLSAFSDMYESGDLSLEEYRSIKHYLAASLSSSVSAREKKAEKKSVDRDMELERLLRGEKR